MTESAYFHRPLKEWDDSALMREYLLMNKHGLCEPVFGGNARRAGNFLADELHRRGITQIPNMFGPIPVTRWSY